LGENIDRGVFARPGIWRLKDVMASGCSNRWLRGENGGGGRKGGDGKGGGGNEQLVWVVGKGGL